MLKPHSVWDFVPQPGKVTGPVSQGMVKGWHVRLLVYTSRSVLCEPLVHTGMPGGFRMNDLHNLVFICVAAAYNSYVFSGLNAPKV